MLKRIARLKTESFKLNFISINFTKCLEKSGLQFAKFLKNFLRSYFFFLGGGHVITKLVIMF